MYENMLLNADELMWFFEKEPVISEDESCVIFKLNDGINNFEIAFGYALPYVSIKVFSSIGMTCSYYLEQIIEMKIKNDEISEYLYVELKQNNDVSSFSIRIKPHIQINLQSLCS